MRRGREAQSEEEGSVCVCASPCLHEEEKEEGEKVEEEFE